MIHEQEQQSYKWHINHGLNKTDIDIQCWIDKQGALTRIIPQQITVQDNNTVELTFLRPCTGTVQITPSTRWEQFNK